MEQRRGARGASVDRNGTIEHPRGAVADPFQLHGDTKVYKERERMSDDVRLIGP